MHPFTQIDVARLVVQVKIDGHVPMSENEIVVVLFFQHFAAIHDEPFLIVAQVYLVFMSGGASTVARK